MRAYMLRHLGLECRCPTAPERPRDDKAKAADAPGSVRELIHDRSWRGTKTTAEIDTQIAEERASWHDGCRCFGLPAR